VVSATGEGGYVLEQRALDGHVTAHIHVDQPRRAVTAPMREARIAQELERLSGAESDGMVDPEETRRHAREMKFADSLPPYELLFPAPDGTLWVTDYATLADSSWSATAFRADGAIVGRLTTRIRGTPVSFGDGRVLIRLVDEDGVVRFGLYRLLQAGN
jgi:hypothetical protein